VTTRHFDHIVHRIDAARRKADSLASGIGHPGIEGQIREIAARECVEPFLTHSYQCSTGKVIDTLQLQSDQIDLIIYHRKIAPPILIDRNLGLFPVECVRYAFEIKTTLTADGVRDANKKFRSVSSLISFPRKQADDSIKGGPMPSTVLFAFGSDISGSELERYQRHTEDGHPPCTVLCVLGKGYWFYHNEAGWLGHEASEDQPQYTEFCMFIAGLMNSLAADQTSLRPFSPGAYVSIDDVVFWRRQQQSQS
jgi:hypothetical protein